MLKKALITGLCIGIFAASPLGAAAVSVLVIETGLSDKTPTSQYSTLWENGLMEVFFESGHIVSNAPMMRLGERPGNDFPSEAERDYANATNGGMDYFVVAIVEHPGYNVSLRLFSTQSRMMIREQWYTGRRPNGTKEEYENIKRVIRVLVAQIM